MRALLQISFLSLLFLSGVLRAQPDSSHLNIANFKPEDIKWAKSEGNGFWFYHKPTRYFFKDTEFKAITLESGEVLVYVFIQDKYYLLPEFPSVEKDKEKPVELASAKSSVYIRNTRGRFWIFDRGMYVNELEKIGTNSIHQVVYRSRFSDKRYFIDESDFYYGPVSKAIPILSE
jgi:hypothetical protein